MGSEWIIGKVGVESGIHLQISLPGIEYWQFGRADVEEIPFQRVIEMISQAEESARGSTAATQYHKELDLLEEVRNSHQPTSLKEFRALFSARAFDLQTVERWWSSGADLLAMTAYSVLQGYTEFIEDSGRFSRFPAGMLETVRRRDIDRNPDFGSFTSFYSDEGK